MYRHPSARTAINVTAWKHLQDEGSKNVTPELLPLRRCSRSHTVYSMGTPKASTLHANKVHFSKIAALVKRERAAKGISLRELAELTAQVTVNPKTGKPPGDPLSHQQVLRVERGICSIESALTVLKALNVSKLKRAQVVVSEMHQLAMAS